MRLLIATATWFAQAYYALLKALFPARRKVVLLSRQSDRPSRDFTMLADELRSRDSTLEVVVRCRFIGPTVPERVAYLGEVLAQMYHLATSRVCIVDGYVIPVSLLTHRRQLTVVQMWHALGAVKRFGYQSLDRPGGRASGLARSMQMHRNYDLVLCGGPATVQVFAEAFGVAPDKVRPLGLPRIDYLLEHRDDARVDPAPSTVEELRRRYPVLADTSRRTVLYAPTFRRNRPDHYREMVERFGGDRYTLIVKPHPLVRTVVAGDNVVNACDIDILDLLPLSDVVITDYSAVAFEACVLDKPVYFYVFDIDEYIGEHGLNIDMLSEMSIAASRDLDEIAARIDAEEYPVDLLATLKERYVPITDGSCTARIADLVLTSLEGSGPR